MDTEIFFTTQSVPPTETIADSTNASGDDDVCTQESDIKYQMFWIAIISVILLCNTFLLIAIAKSWRILKQNIVNRYLISCLLSVMSFCALSAFEILHTLNHVDANFLGETVLQRLNTSNPLHWSVMQRYAYRKGVLPILAIVMQFNISVLIYATSDSICFVGRYTTPKMLNKTQSELERSKHLVIFVLLKKHRHVIMCLLAWLGPFALSIPVAFGWNCINYCICLPAYRWSSTCVSEADVNECSRVWLPISRSFVFVISALYASSTAMNFGMIFSTVRKFRKTHGRQSPSPRNPPTIIIGEATSKDEVEVPGTSEPEMNGTNSDSPTVSNQNSPSRESDIRIPTVIENTQVVDAHNSQRDENTRRKRRQTSFYYGRGRRRPLDRTIILVIVIATSMFIFVTPMICVWFLDVVIVSDVSRGFGFSIGLSLSYVYAASLPFILLKYMSGLQKACVSFMMKCPCFHTTVKKSSKSTPVMATTSTPKSDSNNIFTLNPNPENDTAEL